MNDAQGCFDCIAHTPAVLSLRRQGVPASALRSLYSTLQNAEHAICSGFGRSPPLYGGPTQIPPVQGEGQGSGKAPATWVAISSVLIRMVMESICVLSFLINPSNLYALLLWMTLIPSKQGLLLILPLLNLFPHSKRRWTVGKEHCGQQGGPSAGKKFLVSSGLRMDGVVMALQNDRRDPMEDLND